MQYIKFERFDEITKKQQLEKIVYLCKITLKTKGFQKFQLIKKQK